MVGVRQTIFMFDVHRNLINQRLKRLRNSVRRRLISPRVWWEATAVLLFFPESGALPRGIFEWSRSRYFFMIFYTLYYSFCNLPSTAFLWRYRNTRAQILKLREKTTHAEPFISSWLQSRARYFKYFNKREREKHFSRLRALLTSRENFETAAKSLWCVNGGEEKRTLLGSPRRYNFLFFTILLYPRKLTKHEPFFLFFFFAFSFRKLVYCPVNLTCTRFAYQ